MKEIINTYFDIIFKLGLTSVIFSTLFLFANQTTEFYETPKFIVLLIFSGIFLILLTLRFTINNKVVLTRTPLDLPLILLLLVGVISTVLSPSPYVSLLGNQLKFSTSLISIIALILFYFILVNSIKNIRTVKAVVYLIVFGGALLSLLSILSFFGIKLLPAIWTHALNFTPTGSSFSTTAVLAMILPIVVSEVLFSRNLVAKGIFALFIALFGLTITLTGSYSTWIAGAVAVFLPFYINNPRLDISRISLETLIALGSALFVVILSVALSLIPSFGFGQNPIHTQFVNFPREVTLPFNDSWKISVSAFRDSPFWGTGPSTYAFNFTSYKPVEFNSTKFWNIRFDSSFNEYLYVLGTLGGIGLLALISLTAMFISSAWKDFLRNVNTLNTSLAVSGITFFVILFLHTSTLVVWVIGLILLACFMVLKLEESNASVFQTSTVRNVLLGLSEFTSNKPSTRIFTIEALPSILLSISLGLVLTTFFLGGKFVLAEYHHRNALNAISQNNGILAYNELIAAEKLNPWIDLYRTNLAQVNFALANAIAASKGPTEASPGGSLNDQDKQNLQVLLQQSISEGKTATTLSPRSAINWEILGLLYRQIAGVAQNALLFSLDSYGRAIFNDPLNPALRLSVGGVYYAVKNYDLAIRFFTDSINIKGDYANGYYNLSVALRDKGDLNAALQAAEKVISLVDPASPDYKIASDYLNDLKAKVGGPPTEPPAATTTGALQQEDLPEVIDLPKPDKIATPEAIKKSPAPSPTPSPQP